MAMVSEFIAAVNQISSERGIESSKVFEALESAVAAAYKKEYHPEADVVVEMSRETGEFTVIVKKNVVEEVLDEKLEMSIEEAQSINSALEIDDQIEIEQSQKDFGRIAAQTAKQVVMQTIRDFEKDAIISEYSDKVGEIFSARMQRMRGGAAIFEIGKAVAIMPLDQQISNEFYKVGERYKVLLKEIEDGAKGKTLIISRNDPELLNKLFEMEVPEIESGVVEVMSVAREAGFRSKIAVKSNQEGIDAIGSCVGQRGVRITNVMSELGEEKIDIIEWDEDLDRYVANALSPAEVNSVKVFEEEDVVEVDVPEDQLSLAIGREGQNVRLAANLTETKINIKGPDEEVVGSADMNEDGEMEVTVDMDEISETEIEEPQVEEKEEGGLDGDLVKKIEDAGVTVDEASKMDKDGLMQLDGVGEVTADKILEAFKESA